MHDGVGLQVVNRLRSDRSRFVFLGAQDVIAGRAAWCEMGRPGNVSVLSLNVANTDSIVEAVNRVQAMFGRVDALINIAGVSEAEDAQSAVSMIRVIDINVRGVMQVCDSFRPIIRNGGRVVNVCALSGYPTALECPKLSSRLKSPHLTRYELHTLMHEYSQHVIKGSCHEAGWPNNVYAVSELGEMGYCRIIAREWSKSNNICVMNCCPGFSSANMDAGHDIQTPWQGAEVPVWLAAELSDEVVHALNGASFTHNKEIQFVGSSTI